MGLEWFRGRQLTTTASCFIAVIASTAALTNVTTIPLFIDSGLFKLSMLWEFWPVEWI